MSEKYKLKLKDSEELTLQEVKDYIKDYLNQWFNNDFDDTKKYGKAFEEVQKDDKILTDIANKVKETLIKEKLDLNNLEDTYDVNYFIYNILRGFANKKKNLKDDYGNGDLQIEREGEKDDQYIIIEGTRDGYGIDQVEDNTMTVGELIDYLSQFDRDTKVVIGNDFKGDYYYTYGAINYDSLASADIVDPEEDYDEEDEEDV